VISALAARRLKHEPVARILGRKEFWSLELQVTPSVLVPRPETETVIEAALDVVVARGLRMDKLRLLDARRRHAKHHRDARLTGVPEQRATIGA